MIFIDSNVPMYLIGAAHSNKDAAIRAIEAAVTRRERMVASAEVLQEILHRYHALGRPEMIQPCIKTLLGLVDEVYAIEQQDVLRARDVLLRDAWAFGARRASRSGNGSARREAHPQLRPRIRPRSDA